jgi:hypothetical protein
MEAGAEALFSGVDYAERERRQQEMIDNAIARFPKEFGLKAFPGQKFMINRGQSYWDTGVYHGKRTHPPGPILYVYVYTDGRWVSFAKGSPDELTRSIVPAP